MRARALALLAGLVVAAAIGACDLVLGVPDRTLDPHLVCASGACACAAGFADCDGKIGNGCEAALATDLANCGACGNDCQNGDCSAGACACHENFADCDGKPQNGCEAGLETDGMNCGACGHDCLGAACVGGLCQAIQIGAHQTTNALQIAGGALYLGVCSEASPILRIPLDGGAPAPAVIVAGAADAGTCCNSMSVSGQNMFWSETNDAMPIGVVVNPLTPATPPTVIGPGAQPTALAGGPGVVYWSDTTVPAVYRVPAAGGPPVMVSGLMVQAIATDTDNAYLSDGAGVYSVSHTGTSATTISNAIGVFAIAVSNGTLYLGLNPGVATVPTTGGKTTMLSSAGAPYAMTVDGSFLYYSDTNANTISKLPLAGGVATTLVAGVSISYSSAIAVDGPAVYYVANEELFKVAK